MGLSMKKWSIILLLILIMILSACSNEEELILGKYAVESEPFPIAQVHLLEEDKFILNGPVTISFVTTGEYEIKGDKLHLKSSDEEEHVFLIEDDKLIFESGVWLGNWVEKGTEFHFLNGNK